MPGGEENPRFPVGDDVVNQAVFLGLLAGHIKIPLGILIDAFNGLAGVFGHNPVQFFPQAQNLLGLDVHVRGLALEAAQGLVDQDPGVGQGKLLPLAPAVSSSAAMDAPWPMHRVATGLLMYCMVSYMAIPEVTRPPGELM